MEKTLVLKALADETRMNIVQLLLRHNYCVGALARKLDVSEGAVSQHLKVLREAGLLRGRRKGYFMHYDVDRDALRLLAAEIEGLASVERVPCTPARGRCQSASQGRPLDEKQGHSDGTGKGCHSNDSGRQAR
ncbi:MAG: winged helix-turn-helix transcriptional regulator [Firmicutes bacterium]|jgi:ArsR family transcriptional regulator|nr:winged helix-turn-helix transcriptional regulator [Bacillota bacterium]